jgi:hypothetical protein
VLYLVIGTNVHLEFEVTKDKEERLRNEAHLVVEQREADLRKRLVEHNCKLECNQSEDRPLKQRVSDFYSNLGDYQALSSFKLKNFIGDLKTNFESHANTWTQTLHRQADFHKET